jgi:WD40 repeat protein
MVKVVKGLPDGWGMCSRVVLLSSVTPALSCWNNNIAVGSKPGDIIILNAITGSKASVLSGHTKEVNSLTFLSNGTSLVSGSDDCTVKLWDMQTGGVVETFYGHTNWVYSVSISADCATIASGSSDNTIRLWDTWTGKCHHVISQQSAVRNIRFSPTDPQHLISICDSKVWQWNTDGHQIKPPYGGSHIAFSPDGAQFVSCHKNIVTVHNSKSAEIVAEFHVTDNNTCCCCFSADSRLVAVAASSTIYVWDITSSSPHLIETFICYTNKITSLAFSSPSTLISAYGDQSVRFWQIKAPSTDLGVANPTSISLTSPIKSITLQAKYGITITTDSDGVVRTWDILTGLCKVSFQTPATASCKRDVQLINGKLICVWHADRKLYVWDTEKRKSLLEIDSSWPDVEDLRISADGARVFCLGAYSICAWSIHTGEVVGKATIEYSKFPGSLTVDGSKVWAYWPQSKYQGWDLGISGSSPIQLSNMPTLLPDGSMLWDVSQARIKNAVTGEVVFQLPRRFAKPVSVQCDGYHLAAGYNSGEVLILNLNHILLQ